MTSKEATTKLIALIVKNGVDIPSSNGHEEIRHSHNNYGSWSLDFVIHFDNTMSNYKSSTYLQPSECNISIAVHDIEDVEIYVNNDQILVNDKDMKQIEEAILTACNKEL